ncbi:MAG TPA: HXXEE domain-containing protein, partial [Rhizobiaceae bacterium]|nr:HXXEE domain-containing protein [Rhizobiaceae bacterium]
MVLQRLFRLWVYGGFLAGILLLALTPLLAQGWSPALTAVWLLLPIYMLHQFEEHDNDRFRAFVNQHIGHGREALTLPVVFIVNVPGVWGVIALATYLAA